MSKSIRIMFLVLIAAMAVAWVELRAHNRALTVQVAK